MTPSINTKENGNYLFGASNSESVTIKAYGTFGAASLRLGYGTPDGFVIFAQNNPIISHSFEWAVDCGFGCDIGFVVTSADASTDITVECRGL